MIRTQRHSPSGAQGASTYASHLPVLNLLLALFKPKRVLELGLGIFSTPAFLADPNVEYLRSVETDYTWAVSFAQTFGDDERLEVKWTDDTVAALPPLTDYDLCFVDNANNATDRLRTIRAVLSEEHPVTVIHDAEFPAYRRAIRELAPDALVYDLAEPHTAVVLP